VDGIDEGRLRQLHEELGRVVVQNIQLTKRVQEMEKGDEEKAKQLKEQRIYSLERELSHAKRKIEGFSRQTSVVSGFIRLSFDNNQGAIVMTYNTRPDLIMS